MVMLFFSIIISCGMGSVKVSASEFFSILSYKFGFSSEKDFTTQQEAIICVIRLPRVITSVLIGAVLAICGASIQGLFRNPLADPGIIGISSGAAMAASIAIVFAGSGIIKQSSYAGFSILYIAAFLGACVTAFLVFRIAKEKTKTNVGLMLLAGIALNAISGAVMGLLTYLSTDAQLRDLTFWTLGSLGGANWKSVLILLITTSITIFFLLRLAKSLNALSLGEKEALHIGTPVEKVKNTIIIITSLAIGVAVAFCGIIGFIGLVVPHILRLSGSYDHRFLIPASAIGGALLLCVADTTSRTLAAPAEIPVGIITSLVGAPVFLFLLIQQKTKFA